MIAPEIQKGFTLIELLVVISIVTLLSSIVYASAEDARVVARDTNRVSQAKEVQKAIVLHIQDHGQGPANYKSDSSIAVQGVDTEFDQSMQDLVDGGYLGQLPEYTGVPYFYKDFGTGSTAGVVFGTSLEHDRNQTDEGLPGSCRPFNSGDAVVVDPEDPEDTDALLASVGLSEDIDSFDLSEDTLALITVCDTTCVNTIKIMVLFSTLHEEGTDTDEFVDKWRAISGYSSVEVESSPELQGCYSGGFLIAGFSTLLDVARAFGYDGATEAHCDFDVPGGGTCTSEYSQVWINGPYGTCETEVTASGGDDDPDVCNEEYNGDYCLCTTY